MIRIDGALWIRLESFTSRGGSEESISRIEDLLGESKEPFSSKPSGISPFFASEFDVELALQIVGRSVHDLIEGV